MEGKNEYYNLLKTSNGKLNELELGEAMGLDEDQTQEIIAQLLSEHKIAYKTNKACNYSVMTRDRKSSKKGSDY
jgi:hypothetical protein